MEEKVIGPATNEIWCSGGFGKHGHKTFWNPDDDPWEDSGKWTCIDCQRYEANFDHSDRIGARPWGKYFVLDEATGYKVKRIEVAAGKRLSLQSHRGRVEHWTCVEGTGKFTVGSSEVLAVPGTSVVIDVEQVHRMENTGEKLFVVIEVQRGNCDEADIFRISDDFGRANGDGQV